MSTPPHPVLRVLIVEDEPVTAAAHADYLGRLDGFEVAALAATGREALQFLHAAETEGATPIDLILLDMNLPDTHGIEFCRRLRAAGSEIDVMAITAVREVKVVRASIAVGIVQYLIKPFTFASFSEKLTNYRDFRERFDDTGTLLTQGHVDHSLAALRAPGENRLSKGLSEETLSAVVRMLGEGPRDAGLTAADTATTLSISRVTARRYLEHLADSGVVERIPRYGTRGRPELEYRITS